MDRCKGVPPGENVFLFMPHLDSKPAKLFKNKQKEIKLNKINAGVNFIPLILAIFSLQKTIFDCHVTEPPCLMTLLMHCYQVVPSVFGQMCSVVCLLSINYLYLKFNGSYIYLDICT